MFRLTEALSLGLHAMKALGARPRRRVNTGQIARKFGFSEAHLAKVMQALGRARLVASVRGPAGGFTLARPAREIRLLAIVEAIEGSFDVNKCPFNLPRCGGKACMLGRQMMKQRRDFRRFLAATTLDRCISAGEAKGKPAAGRGGSKGRRGRRR